MRRGLIVLSLALVVTSLGFAVEKSSMSDTSDYRAACLEASKNLANFKQDTKYREILEHLTMQDGSAYLKYISKNYPDILNQIELINTNDKLGNPSVYHYPQVGLISPTTLRYAKVAGDLGKFFGSLDHFDIVEIGGGYGGQAFILSSLFNVSSYSLIDLPEALKLQDGHLTALFTKHNTIQAEQLDQVGPHDLVISNYAFTECDKKTQQLYLEKVIAKAKAGYMICNQISSYAKVDSLSKSELVSQLKKLGFVVQILSEEPKTYPGNYLLVFKKP